MAWTRATRSQSFRADALRLRCRDCAGLESLPLKLMIVAIVASLSIIPAAQALESMKNRDLFRKAEIQLGMIISSAEILAINGPGNIKTIALDFSGGGSLKFERLFIGDARDGANMTCVILRTTSGGAMIKSANEPAVWMTSPNQQRLEISVPTFNLRLTSMIMDSTTFVQAEVS